MCVKERNIKRKRGEKEIFLIPFSSADPVVVYRALWSLDWKVEGFFASSSFINI